ncbi:MAG: ATP synthase delta/epsilon chain alpha-helix domain-containing protein, partial [Centipeda sp. (in: firmicutes)]
KQGITNLSCHFAVGDAQYVYRHPGIGTEKITVLATAAEEPIDIDINRAQRAYERAQERLRLLRESPETEGSIIDEQRASLALKRAAARLQTAKAQTPGA